jgi:hypothetical protein
MQPVLRATLIMPAVVFAADGLLARLYYLL